MSRTRDVVTIQPVEIDLGRNGDIDSVDAIMDESQSTAVAEPPVDISLLDRLLHNRISENEARQFASENPGYIAFTLLALQQHLASVPQSIGPNTPSLIIPPYQKPPIKPNPNRRGRKKGVGQPGHIGCTRDSSRPPSKLQEASRAEVA